MCLLLRCKVINLKIIKNGEDTMFRHIKSVLAIILTALIIPEEIDRIYDQKMNIRSSLIDFLVLENLRK